jgi:Tol biopolymer transport system component
MDAQPSTSPDGKRIAYMSNADGNWEIYVMNWDGTGRLRLTRNVAGEAAPHWSPDGNKIIFASNRSGKFALYTIDLSAS